MNRIRLLVAAGIIAGLVWLNWWVVPTLGLFRMALFDPPLPENGYSLIFFQEGKSINATALDTLKTGWPIVWQVWPFARFLHWLPPGGELARRKFAIDGASAYAIRLGEELRTEAHEKHLSAEKALKEAQALDARTRSMKAELSREQQEIFVMKVTAEAGLEAAEGLRQRAVSLQKELVKAKAKIRRMAEKSGRQPYKPIDDCLYLD
ncbi:MAG: hypothetical protein E4H46_03295 [Desulfobacterales bacterium]|nr:MAG: hypothetical protein E4H46_03295 [Desulfobacterales bacterium]